jgi:thiol-disulfide isomerase/thioredoxin
MPSGRLKAIHVVYANWCPHCVPTTLEPMKKAAQELNVPCILHDIDTDDVTVADELVEKYGDWTPDYLVPQVFLEFDNGEYMHVLTGYSEGVSFTRRAVENLLKSQLFQELKAGGPATTTVARH